MASPFVLRNPVRPPSQAEIMDLVIANLPAMRVYNPSPEWITQSAGGIVFFIPPDLNGAEIPHRFYSTDEKPVMIKADGILEVKNVYGKNRQGDRIVVIDAGDIIRVLTMNRGEMGLSFLPGGKKDEAVKEAARVAWRQFRAYQAQRELAAWGEKIAKHNANPMNEGKPKPIPPQHVLDAMNFQDFELSGSGTYKFQCNCSYVSNDISQFQGHLRVTGHKSITALPPETPVQATTKPVQSK